MTDQMDHRQQKEDIAMVMKSAVCLSLCKDEGGKGGQPDGCVLQWYGALQPTVK